VSTVKKCKECGGNDPEKLLRVTRKGKVYRRSLCRRCHRVSQKAWRKAHPERSRQIWIRAHERRKAKRKRGDKLENFIWRDSRKTDKKKGLENDLTKEFIAEQIAKGCCYCGEKELRMTLDRVDNELGHMMDNVVPACIRCNYIRGNMPHEAWLCFRAALRRARRDGLFGDWTGKIK
jgi:hypothetical protein